MIVAAGGVPPAGQLGVTFIVTVTVANSPSLAVGNGAERTVCPTRIDSAFPVREIWVGVATAPAGNALLL
jgi:hypothetical protein